MDWTDEVRNQLEFNHLAPLENPCRLYVTSAQRRPWGCSGRRRAPWKGRRPWAACTARSPRPWRWQTNLWRRRGDEPSRPGTRPDGRSILCLDENLIVQAFATCGSWIIAPESLADPPEFPGRLRQNSRATFDATLEALRITIQVCQMRLGSRVNPTMTTRSTFEEQEGRKVRRSFWV